MVTIHNEWIDFKKVADSGQCFTFDGEKAYYKDLSVRVYRLDNNLIQLDCSQDEYEKVWENYFDLDDTDYYFKFYKLAKDSKYEYIRNAVEFSKGMVILRQEPFETLISFVISQRNSIPKIKSTVSKIKQLTTGNNRFPTAKEIVDNKDKLANAGLGYRYDYVINISTLLNHAGMGIVNSYDKALRLYGVGPKVASCYSLYGLHIMDMFPIDVWIQRILDREFNSSLEFLKEFKGYEGILQQCMFYYERNRR